MVLLYYLQCVGGLTACCHFIKRNLNAVKLMWWAEDNTKYISC